MSWLVLTSFSVLRCIVSFCLSRLVSFCVVLRCIILCCVVWSFRALPFLVFVFVLSYYWANGIMQNADVKYGKTSLMIPWWMQVGHHLRRKFYGSWLAESHTLCWLVSKISIFLDSTKTKKILWFLNFLQKLRYSNGVFFSWLVGSQKMVGSLLFFSRSLKQMWCVSWMAQTQNSFTLGQKEESLFLSLVQCLAVVS